MAKTLSSASITEGLTVEAWHVTQSVDALNGVEAYDLTISGSLTLTNDTTMTGTASYAVTASYAENAGGGGSSDTGSLLTTASFSDPTLTFTKGDASTFGIDLTDLNVDNALRTTITIKNVSSGAILKGTPCFITASGTSGNVAGVIPASASVASSMPAGVVANEDLLTTGDEGVGIVVGWINGVDTSAFTSGDSVYVGENGGYTNVRPTGASNLVQKLGNIEKVDASNGSGVVSGAGRSNDVPNISPGYIWVGGTDGVADTVPTSSLGNNLYLSGSLNTHIIPATNDTYDLGSPEYKFRDLYLGSSTLYMSGSGGWMSGSWDGTNFNVNNNALVRSAVTSSMTVENSQKSICNFNVTADPNNPLTGNLNFAAGGAILGSGTVLISAFGAELQGLILGEDCWVTVTAVNGGGSTGIFDVSLDAGGRITITEIGGASNATVMYQIMYYLP